MTRLAIEIRDYPEVVEKIRVLRAKTGWRYERILYALLELYEGVNLNKLDEVFNRLRSRYPHKFKSYGDVINWLLENYEIILFHEEKIFTERLFRE